MRVYRVYRIIEVEKTEIYLFLAFLFPLSSELNFLFRDEERKTLTTIDVLKVFNVAQDSS